MRWRLMAILLAITIGLGVVQVLTPKEIATRTRVVTTISSIICPSSSGGASVAISGRGVRLSPIGKLPNGVKDVPFTTSKDVTTMQLSSVAHLVEKSVGGTTQIDTSSGLAGLACPNEDSSYWFVGGSAALASQDRLILSNAGHGEATATILAWTNKGAVPAYPVVVPAQTSIRVGLDSIVPGVNVVVIHLLVRSGRLAVSLYDQRTQGLTNLGADFVPQGIDPARKFVILGVPGISGVSRKFHETRVLRLLSPKEDSSVRVDVIGAGDSFTPLGLDSIELKAGIVLDIPVTAALPSSAYAFEVTADSPVVAGVFSNVGTSKGSDIVWSASTPGLSAGATSADFEGTTYLFYSHIATSVDITTTYAGSIPVATTLAIPAENVVRWTPGKSSIGAAAIRFGSTRGMVYVARILRNSSGVTTSPLRQIIVSGRSRAPLTDIGVGMPR